MKHQRVVVGRVQRGVAAAVVAVCAAGATVGIPSRAEAGSTLRVCAAGCPFSDVQSAAAAAASGDTIQIGRGTFLGTLWITDKSLKLVGSGAGATILTNTDSSGTVMSTASVVRLDCSIPGSYSISLDGLTVTGGSSRFGAGLRNSGCAASVTNAIVTANNAGTGVFPAGGGIANLFDGTLTVRNSTVSSNVGRSAGGIYSDSGSVVIQDSRVTDNTATGGTGHHGRLDGGTGGGVLMDAGTLTVKNSVVSGNSVLAASSYRGHVSGQGAGIYVLSGLASIEGSTVKDNAALQETGIGEEGDGGAIFNVGSVTITGSTIKANRAANGGGVYNLGTVSSRSSNITDNVAASGNGGGIFNAGQLALLTATINRNSSSGTLPTAGKGGGMYTAPTGSSTVKNSGIVGNTASLGGGLFTEAGGTIDVAGTAIRGNTPDNCNGGAC